MDCPATSNPAEPEQSEWTRQLLGRVNYERQVPAGSHAFKLDSLRTLLELRGNPHLQVPMVHIAGTKGKGTVTRLIARIFLESGYQTGTYTSPHLESICERFQIGNDPVSETLLDESIKSIWPAIVSMDQLASENSQRRLTFFDIATAIAFQLFAEHKLDLAVLETGLGGRLDSTNVCQPLVSVITSISLDHTRQLGSTVAEIAGEKAGIIKHGIPVVSGVPLNGDAAKVIARVASEKQSRLIQYERDFFAENVVLMDGETRFDLKMALPGMPDQIDGISMRMQGEHSANNAAVAAVTSLLMDKMQSHGRIYRIEEPAIRSACAKMYFPGRIEIVSHDPLVVLDVAHNEASVGALVDTLNRQIGGWQAAACRTVICAISKDKDQIAILRKLLPIADRVIFTRFLENPRATPPKELAAVAESLYSKAEYSGTRDCLIQIAETPHEAWEMALDPNLADQAICICGSLFLVAELGRIVRKKPREDYEIRTQ